MHSTSSIELIRPLYRELLQQLIEMARERFGENLLAVWLMGSIGRGQEQPGISDLDLELILRQAGTEADEAWADELADSLLPSYPELVKLDLGLLPQTELLDPEALRLRFILRSDGLCLYGDNTLPTDDDWMPGIALARLLNSRYRERLDEIRHCLEEPDADERANPQHVAECVRWYAKQALRLSLGLAMCKAPVYARGIHEVAQLAAETLPNQAELIEEALSQYLQPVNDPEAALSWLSRVSSLADIADRSPLASVSAESASKST